MRTARLLATLRPRIREARHILGIGGNVCFLGELNVSGSHVQFWPRDGLLLLWLALPHREMAFVEVVDTPWASESWDCNPSALMRPAKRETFAPNVDSSPLVAAISVTAEHAIGCKIPCAIATQSETKCLDEGRVPAGLSLTRND